MNRWWVVIGLFIIILVAGVALIFVPGPNTANAPTQGGNAGKMADKIVAVEPKPGDSVSSPLKITGEARGGWYFEASFPYELKDAQGKTLAQGPVQAKSDWMTPDFVPFSITITFPTQPAGSKGTLVLKKDNPSGDPARDEELDIPVTFK